VPVKRVPQPGMRRAAMLLMQASSSKSSAASQALLLHTMMQLLKSLQDYQLAARQSQADRQVEAAVRGSLVQVSHTLPPVPGVAGNGPDRDQPNAADRFTAPGHAPVAGAVQQVERSTLPGTGPTAKPSPPSTKPGPGKGPSRR
jgi:hypothetical protein